MKNFVCPKCLVVFLNVKQFSLDVSCFICMRHATLYERQTLTIGTISKFSKHYLQQVWWHTITILQVEALTRLDEPKVLVHALAHHEVAVCCHHLANCEDPEHYLQAAWESWWAWRSIWSMGIQPIIVTRREDIYYWNGLQIS